MRPWWWHHQDEKPVPELRRPRCSECGHSMAHSGYGFACIENTCSIGLAVLGDFASAERRRRRERNAVAVVAGD